MGKPKIYPPPLAIVRAVQELASPLPPSSRRLLTATRFQGLADVPPELEWFANISNKSTRRAYENALQDFMRFIGISQPHEFREVTRSHVIAWRDDLASRGLSSQTMRHPFLGRALAASGQATAGSLMTHARLTALLGRTMTTVKRRLIPPCRVHRFLGCL